MRERNPFNLHLLAFANRIFMSLFSNNQAALQSLIIRTIQASEPASTSATAPTPVLLDLAVGPFVGGYEKVLLRDQHAERAIGHSAAILGLRQSQ
jgi:hypothetical protein